MAIHTRVLTKVELPQFVEVEIEDTVRREKTVRRVPFQRCMERLAGAGPVSLEEVDASELIMMVFAIAKHIAIDEYLTSIGVDPHQDVRPLT
jgi:hypothetical protein